MLKYIKQFVNHTAYLSAESNLDKPNVSLCVQEDEVHYNPMPYDYSKDYLTTVALENGTISFNIWNSMGTDMITSISYSTDNGETWTTTNNMDNKTEHLVIDVSVNEGDKVMWKGIAAQTGYDDEDVHGDYVGSFFSSTCEFDIQGNVMSLLYGDDFKGETTIEGYGTFCRLFSDYGEQKTCSVVNAKDLLLPATTLTVASYISMFNGCSNLVTAPELPATTLAGSCYSYMFQGCTSLTTAPSVLPATALTEGCYESMFYGCTSLVSAPVLPATTLTNACYYSMFKGCTSLVSAPVLPATTLADTCYSYMFQGCTKLNYIKAMFTTIPGSDLTDSWVDGVAASGTFIKNSAATWYVTSANGVPTGWTVETATA